MLTLWRQVSGKEVARLIRQRYAPVAEDFSQIRPLSSGELIWEPVDQLIQLRVENFKFNEVDYRRLVGIIGKDVLVRHSDSGASN